MGFAWPLSRRHAIFCSCYYYLSPGQQQLAAIIAASRAVLPLGGAQSGGSQSGVAQHSACARVPLIAESRSRSNQQHPQLRGRRSKLRGRRSWEDAEVAQSSVDLTMEGFLADRWAPNFTFDISDRVFEYELDIGAQGRHIFRLACPKVESDGSPATEAAVERAGLVASSHVGGPLGLGRRGSGGASSGGRGVGAPLGRDGLPPLHEPGTREQAPYVQFRGVNVLLLVFLPLVSSNWQYWPTMAKRPPVSFPMGGGRRRSSDTLSGLLALSHDQGSY